MSTLRPWKRFRPQTPGQRSGRPKAISYQFSKGKSHGRTASMQTRGGDGCKRVHGPTSSPCSARRQLDTARSRPSKMLTGSVKMRESRRESPSYVPRMPRSIKCHEKKLGVAYACHQDWCRQHHAGEGVVLVLQRRQTWEQDYHAGHGGGFLGS